MQVLRIPIIMNGVTGRMGARQHLARSIMAIREEGGISVAPGTTIVPEPLLVGRDAAKLEALSHAHGGLPFSAALEEALADPKYIVYFDAQVTERRYSDVCAAIAAGKHIYCEKPSAATSAQALDLFQRAEEADRKHGVVQDKLWLPGFHKLKELIDQNFFGEIFSVRGEFGYWVFTGEKIASQRPSWNYRSEDGGGIISDMMPHWQYVIENLFGPLKEICCLGAVHVRRRWDESGNAYTCTAEDAAYATLVTEQGVVCQFNSSWCVRVRRDDLVVLQVDGSQGSAVVGLHNCYVQPAESTSRVVWNPDEPPTEDFLTQWKALMPEGPPKNAFRSQWELFLRHVALDEPFPWNLLQGARGVRLAELALQSWREKRWVSLSSPGHATDATNVFVAS